MYGTPKKNRGGRRGQMVKVLLHRAGVECIEVRLCRGGGCGEHATAAAAAWSYSQIARATLSVVLERRLFVEHLTLLAAAHQSCFPLLCISVLRSLYMRAGGQPEASSRRSHPPPRR